MKKLYVLVVVAMLAAMVLPMTASADWMDDPLYLSGKVYDVVNQMGIGGTTVELWYERTTIVSADRWDPDRYKYEWILVDTCVTESRGFWMVDTLAAHPGMYKIKFRAPEDALLDGQAVTYTADNSFTWNIDVPNYRADTPLDENPENGPNECEFLFYNDIDDAKTGQPYVWGDKTLVWVFNPLTGKGQWMLNIGDGVDIVLVQELSLVVNYQADVTALPEDACGYADMMYVYGMVYDPTIAGDPLWPDKKADGIGNVEVQLWRQWLGHGWPSPWVGPVWGQAQMIRSKMTNGDGYYFFAVEPTDTPGDEDYVYFLMINGVWSPDFVAKRCPQVENYRVEGNFNTTVWNAEQGAWGVYDSLHTLP